MRRSKDDYILAIRFNTREKEILDLVFEEKSRYDDDGYGTVIKRILMEEYNKIKCSKI